MTSSDVLRTALAGLRANRTRSALTALGIVIGVTAVILVVAVSRGGTSLILQQVQGIGSSTVVVRAGRQPRGPSDFGEFFTDSLKQREVQAIQDPARIRGVVAVAPNVIISTSIASDNETMRTSVLGTAPAFVDIFHLPEPDGRFLTDDDLKSRARVAVIGTDVKDELFGNSAAFGARVKIKGLTFRVVGVFPPAGQAGPFDVDRIVMIPNTIAQEKLLGIKHYQSIVVRAASDADVNRLAEDIRQTLRELHGITDPEKDDFFVATQADLLRIIGTITTVLTVLLVSIAAISLLVGGVGIMNIMLVSVTERTREIGLRKAVGATTQDILLQFLLEAALLTSVGGLVGSILGLVLSFVASLVIGARLGLQWTFQIPWSAIGLGVGVATIVGLVFGLYPALRAARAHPIEALRYE